MLAVGDDHWHLLQGRTQVGGLELTPPFELDILQKLYYKESV